MDMLNIDTT